MPHRISMHSVLTPANALSAKGGSARSVRHGSQSLRQVWRTGLLCGGLLALSVQVIQPTPLRALLGALVQPNAAQAAPASPAPAGDSEDPG